MRNLRERGALRRAETQKWANRLKPFFSDEPNISRFDAARHCSPAIASGDEPPPLKNTRGTSQGGDGGCLIYIRPKCGAIDETLNAIAESLLRISPTSSRSTCTSGLRRSTLN